MEYRYIVMEDDVVAYISFHRVQRVQRVPPTINLELKIDFSVEKGNVFIIGHVRLKIAYILYLKSYTTGAKTQIWRNFDANSPTEPVYNTSVSLIVQKPFEAGLINTEGALLICNPRAANISSKVVDTSILSTNVLFRSYRT